MTASTGKYVRRGAPLAERLLSRVEIDLATGCWLWTGRINVSGYGQIGIGGKSLYVHRVSYEVFVGEVPDGLDLDHVYANDCRHRHCLNPDHLEPVTRTENMRRSPIANGAKTECKNGHPYNERNTHVDPRTGHRRCRPCNTQATLRLRARKVAVR